MKITHYRLQCYRLPYHREVVWANATEHAGTYAVLALCDDQGVWGVAEGTLKARWSGVSARSVMAALEDVLLPALQEAPFAGVAGARARLAGIPENRLAKAMIDSALWQIEAQHAQQPLWQYLGARTPEVSLTWALTRQAPTQMANEAERMCARYGFKTLKVKGGQGLETDLAALAAIRQAVGEAVYLYVDANSAYPTQEALSYVQALHAAGVGVAEDPVPIQPDADFTQLQARSPLPILVDRRCASVDDARALIACGAKALSTKPGRIGVSEARDIGTLCAGAGVQVAVGLYAESALGTLVSLQYAASVPWAQRLVSAELTFYLELQAQVTDDLPQIIDGHIRLPDTTHLAAAIDWARVARFAI